MLLKEENIKLQEIGKQLQVILYTIELIKTFKWTSIKQYEFPLITVKYMQYNYFDGTLLGKQDHNAVIVIPLKLALKLSMSSGCWVVGTFYEGSRQKQAHSRWLKVVVDYEMMNDNTCYVSLVLYHNIKENLQTEHFWVEFKSEMMISDVYLVTRLFAILNSKKNLRDIFASYEASLQPKFASEINLSYVNEISTFSQEKIKEIELILQYYFTSPRYLRIGDIIALYIPIPQSVLNDSIDYIFDSNFLYFKVSSMNGSSETTPSSLGYLVYREKSTLYLSGSVSTKVPYLHGIVSPIGEPVPPCLSSIFDKIYCIYESYRAFLKKGEKTLRSKSDSNSLNSERNSHNCDAIGHILLIGPTGSGKIKLIKLLAERFSCHIKWINCLEIKGDTSAATEGKISQNFRSIQPNSLIVLTRIGCLSVDKDGNDDPRVFIMLKKQLQDVSLLKLKPIIIATIEDQKKISDDLWSLFTYPLTVNCPTQSERETSLLWLLRAYLNLNLKRLPIRSQKEIDNTLKLISYRTSGFYIGDLEEYVMRVQRCLLDKIVSDNNASLTKWDSVKIPSKEDFLKVLDEMQKQRSEALGLPRIPKVQWRDVGGLEEAKKELINTIELPIKHPTLISTSFRRSGILLYGPPGTGKTLLAKSVASECGLNFLSVKGPELINMYIGQSEENVRDAFAKARSASPCVLFFDELDSLAPKRGRSGDSGGVMDRIVSALLTELDGVTGAADVFVLAATNRPDLLDPALLRPGRFEKQIYLGISESREDQIKILKAVTTKIPMNETVSLSSVAEHLPFTLTGADFAALAAEAFYIATRRVVERLQKGGKREENMKVEVCEEDLYEAANRLRPSVTHKELQMYKKMKMKREQFTEHENT